MTASPEEHAEGLRLVRDSVAAIAPPGGDLRRVRALRFTRPGFDRQTWRTMCEMGWPGLRVPEAAGGAGLGMAELCAVMEELGAGLVPEPLPGAALAARLLAMGGASTARTLEDLLAGERLVLPAWQEAAGALDCGSITGIQGGSATELRGGSATTLQDGRLSGTKLFIPMAAGADSFLVVLPDAVALVPAEAPGVTLDLAATQDGGQYGTLTLSHVAAQRVPLDPVQVADALDEATLAVAATLLGVMDRALAMTLDYMRTRRQFGRPIGSFQALQHRAADLQLQVALTRASLGSAAALVDAGAPSATRRAAVSRAKIRAGEAGMRVTREAIQLHGGIGYTDEADVGLFLRRAMVLASQHGSAAVHRARFAALLPAEAEDA